jgi:hypothetical protein
LDDIQAGYGSKTGMVIDLLILAIMTGVINEESVLQTWRKPELIPN